MKVYCLGMMKCGTTSLKHFFEKLGWKCQGFDNHLSKQFDKNNFNPIYARFEHADFIKDTPFWFPKIAEEFKKRYPDAKYILCVRNIDTWIQSRKRHYVTNPLHDPYMGGVSEFHFYTGLGDAIKEYYELVGYYVMNFDPLILHLEDENKKEKVCNYLGIDVPDFDYPHAMNAKKSS